MAVLVLFALKLTQENKIILAAIVYAVSVHVKIYPVVYTLQIYLYLRSKTNGKDSSKSLTDFIKDLWPNRRRLIFIMTAGTTFLGLTGLCYHW
jgi:cobalamin biosynthesis protein CbiG